MDLGNNIKKLPVADILKSALRYCGDNLAVMSWFTFFNGVMTVAGYYIWKTPFIWLLLAAMYVFWVYFFRFYFKRRPYFDVQSLLYSLVPSTKIVVLTTLLALLMAVLPFVPLFLGFSQEFKDEYTLFLQRFMMDSDWIDLGLTLIVVVSSPFLIIRPYLAWISALIGRSGTLRSAWNRTRGNYWEFLLLGVMLGVMLTLFYHLGEAVPQLKTALQGAGVILAVFFNIILAKVYEFFFIDIEK